MPVVNFFSRFWFVWLILTLIVIRLYFQNNLTQDFQLTLTAKSFEQQKLIASIYDNNTQIFIEELGKSISRMSQNPIVVNNEKDAIDIFKVFIEQENSKDYIGGIGVADKNGIYKLNYNTSGIDIKGQSIANNDYYLWAKNQAKIGDYYISKPFIAQFGPTKGTTIFTVTSPLYNNSLYVGSITASIRLKPFLERFFGVIKITDHSDVYIIDNNTNLLYSNLENLPENSNFSDHFNDDPEFKNQIKTIVKTNQIGNFETPKKLVTYSPIILDDQNWYLIISSSKSVIDDQTKEYTLQQTKVTIVALFVLILIGIVVYKFKPK